MYPGAGKKHTLAIMTPLYQLVPRVPPLLKVSNTRNMSYTGQEQSGDGLGFVATIVIELAPTFAFKGVHIDVVVYAHR